MGILVGFWGTVGNSHPRRIQNRMTLAAVPKAPESEDAGALGAAVGWRWRRGDGHSRLTLNARDGGVRPKRRDWDV